MFTLDLPNNGALDQPAWFEAAPRRGANWSIYTPARVGLPVSSVQPHYVRNGSAVTLGHLEAIVGAQSDTLPASDFVAELQLLTSNLKRGLPYQASPELQASADRALTASNIQNARGQSVRIWAKALAGSVFKH